MSELTKKRVRWFEKNKETDEILHDEDVDILTSAEATLFNDGESLQEKYDNGNIARTSQLGDLNALATTNNSNLVDAVNEVNASVSSNTKSIETLGEALDEINNELDNLSSDASEITYNDSTVANALNELNSEVDNVLTTAKSYTDTKVADLVGSAPQTLDTLQEVAQAIEENEDVVDALNSAIGNKASQTDLNALQGVVNTKANQSDLNTTNTNISNLTNTVNTHQQALNKINTDITELQSTVEHLGLPPRPVTDVSATLLNYKDGITELTASWTLAPVYDVQVANINIYGCVSEEEPTDFTQFELITQLDTTSISAELNVEKIYYHILVAPISTNGIVQKDFSQMCKCSVGLNMPARMIPFSEMSWEDIEAVSDSGMASVYFNIGDTKSVDINGTSYQVNIYDFNHDDKADGTGKAGMTIGLKNCLTTEYTVSGGKNALKNTIINQLPEELRNVIKAVLKKTASSQGSTTISTTTDKLFLFSEIEVRSSLYNSMAGEGSLYPIFTDDESRVKRRGDSGTTVGWWLRSPVKSTGSSQYCIVFGDGSNSGYDPTYKYGITFGFCV